MPTLTLWIEGVALAEVDVDEADAEVPSTVTDCADDGPESRRLKEMATSARIVNILAG
jgi:hypothetical protein